MALYGHKVQASARHGSGGIGWPILAVAGVEDVHCALTPNLIPLVRRIEIVADHLVVIFDHHFGVILDVFAFRFVLGQFG